MNKEIFPSLSDDLSKVILPARVEPKYDGEFNLWTGEYFINRYGTRRYLEHICKNLPKDLSLYGELYLPDGKRNFYEALPHLKNNSSSLAYVIYGIAQEMLYCEQLNILKFFPNSIEGITAYSYKEVEYLCQKYVKEGWEGAVIKPLTAKTPYFWIKFKPDKTIDLFILGIRKNKFSVAVGNNKILGYASLVGHTDIIKKLSEIEIIKEDKETYFIEPEIIVEVVYQGWTNTGQLRHPRIKRMREDIKKEVQNVVNMPGRDVNAYTICGNNY